MLINPGVVPFLVMLKRDGIPVLYRGKAEVGVGEDEGLTGLLFSLSLEVRERAPRLPSGLIEGAVPGFWLNLYDGAKGEKCVVCGLTTSTPLMSCWRPAGAS